MTTYLESIMKHKAKISQEAIDYICQAPPGTVKRKRKQDPEILKRDNMIRKAHRCGYSYNELADVYRLTPGAIRIICMSSEDYIYRSVNNNKKQKKKRRIKMSNMNWEKTILNRLSDGKPLTPIEDTDDEFVYSETIDKFKLFSSIRRPSLIKCLRPNGGVFYFDNDRCVGIDINSGTARIHSNLIDVIVDRLCPITMPY